MPSERRRTTAKKQRKPPIGSSLVYALQATDSDRSYVGCTNNFARRLREHNGELKGRGARYTRREQVDPAKPNWSCIFRVTGFPARRQALQFEKLFHRGYKGRRLISVPAKPRNPFGSTAAARRAWHLYWALQKDRFSQQKTIATKRLTLQVEWVRPDFYAVATKLADWGPATVEHILV